MKIALIMPPMDAGIYSYNYFRLLHELAKGKPHWTRAIRIWSNKFRGVIDYEDYPKGLVILATMIEKRHQVRIFNFINNFDTWQDVYEFKPDVIGVTCSTGSNLIWIDTFLRKIKKTLNCSILIGGPHVTLAPVQSFKTTIADFALHGESDFIINKVIDYIDGKISELPKEGLIYTNKRRILVTPMSIVEDLAQLPIPDNSFVNLDKYISIGVESSRGCFRRCSFCFLSGYDEKYIWRPRPVEHIIEEIKQIHKLTEMKNKKIYFLDLNFSINKKRIIELCESIIANGLQSAMWACTDLNLDEETMKKMVEAGFIHIYTGVETGSHCFIKKYKKIGGESEIINFYHKAKKCGLVPEGDLVLLVPGETNESLKDTFNLCKKIYDIPAVNSLNNAKALFAPHIFKPYPNTYDTLLMVNKGWHPPRSFKEWGELYNLLAKGNFKSLSNFIFVNKTYLNFILIRFAWLNFKGYIFPKCYAKYKEGKQRLKFIIYKKFCDALISLKLPGWGKKKILFPELKFKLKNIKLAVFDLCGTLISNSNTWLTISKHYPNAEKKAHFFFRQFEKGKIDYTSLVKNVVNLWKPTPHIKYIQGLIRYLKLNAGAKELINLLKQRGIEIAIISTGIDIFAFQIGKDLGVKRENIYANSLEKDPEGFLTIDIDPIVPIGRKHLILNNLFIKYKINPDSVMVVTNDKYDLELVKRAGIGIFFDNVNRFKYKADLIISSLKDLVEIFSYIR